MLDRLKYLNFCAIFGPIFFIVFFVFWGLLGFNIPPLPGDLPAADVAHVFRTAHDQIRLGMVVSMSGVVSYMVWGLAIAKVIEYGVEEGKNNVLSTLAMWGAGLTVVPLMVSTSFWLTGSYRPEALDDKTLQLLYDMAWLLIDLGYMVTSVQYFALGAAFLQDKRSKPLVPKWFCWFSIWVGFMFIAECLMPYFKSGAFARQGILNFWIEFGIFGIQIIFMSYYLFRAIARLREEAREQNARTA